MEKIRIYELAKELNTTSKRLIEKLLEIKIDVKNHMSYIEGNEVEALYKHIGMVSREGEKKSDVINNNSSFTPRKKSETKKADTQNIPTVLRTTEVKSDSFNNDKQKESNEKYKGNTDKRKDFKGGRRQGGGVKVSAASSGLRSGFVRDNGPIVQTPINKANKVNEPNKIQNVDKAIKVEEVKNEPIIAETKINISTEAKSTLNLSNKEQAPIKPDIKDEQPKIKEKDIKVKSSEEEHIITTKIKDTTAQKSDNQQQNKGKVQAKHSAPSKDSINKDRNIKPRQNSNQRLKGPKDLLDLPIIAEEKRIDENKREHQIKDISKDIKREQKREVPKSKIPDTNKKFKPRNINLDQSKGVSKILQEDEVLVEELIIPTPTVAKRPRRNTRPRRGRGQKGTSEASKMAVERAILTSVKIPETITVKDLAELLKKTAADVIKKLMFMDIMVTLNQEVDYDVASLIAEEYGIKSEKEIIIHAEDILFDDDEEGEEDEANLEPRPPVVVVMGHVDHGKTSLLDAIRETNVIDREQGGITQHIGAYTVKTNDRNITFLDTPGHEAFTSMRARGAKITDIAILVVAADDGVMPQTIEAINHAKAAGVTTIVAINKIDKPTSNPDRIKQQLAEYGLVSEDWGGDIIMVPVSAKSGENIDLLLEMVLLSADIMELKSNPDRQAKGTIIESKLDKNRGPITSLLVQRGTLNVGDSIITGITVGRIRAMNDDKGQSIKTAGPSTPVEILGLPEVSESGQLFYAVKDEKLARDLADKRKQQQREDHLKSSSMVSLEDLFNQIKEGQIKDLNIILKADVQGSVEALKQSIEKLTNPEVRINVIHGGVGAITESDVKLAEVSNAIIIGFNVRPGLNVSEIADASSVDVKLYRVIYDAINDIESAMKGMLTPKLKEVIQGHVEIRQIYKASGIGTIGGSYVLDGKIFRNSSVRLLRNSVVVYEGKLDSLKRFKDDVKEVAQGYECGVLLERFNDIKEGDIVEAYTMEEIKVK